MSYRILWECIASRIGINPDIFSPTDVIDELTDDECYELALASLLDVDE